MTVAVFTIPLPDSTTPSLVQSVSLDGRTYTFAFDWNSRTDRWSLSIANEGGGAGVITGTLLQTATDMLRHVPGTLDTAPPGQLYLAGPDDPTLESIAQYTLYYITEET